MKAFRVNGTFRMGQEWSPFTIEVAGESEDGAKERTYSDLGSRHRCDRRHIKIDGVAEISADEVTDPVVAHRIQG